MENKDSIIKSVWKSRGLLLEKHGGIEGFIEHIKKMEQEHPERLITPDQVKSNKKITICH